MLDTRYALSAVAAVLLAGCGDPETDTAAVDPPQAPAPEAAAPEPPPMMQTEPPIAREPQIPPPSAHIALNPGTYRADDIALSLSALRFELVAPDEGVSAEGTYQIINSILTLTATTGETGDASFPIACGLSRAGPQILLETVDDGSCGFLDGLLFQRETQPG